MEKIFGAIRDLTQYALATGLIEKEDVIYTVNSLLGALGIDDYPGSKEEIIEGAGSLDRAAIEDGSLLEGILAEILDYAAGKDMLDGSSVVPCQSTMGETFMRCDKRTQDRPRWQKKARVSLLGFSALYHSPSRTYPCAARRASNSVTTSS